DAGLDVPDDFGVFDLLGGFSDALDKHLHRTQGRTDLGEMAQLAAVELLNGLLGARAANLFEATTEDVRRAARGLSTKHGFAALAHAFCPRFMQLFLPARLDRDPPPPVGGNGRFADPQEHAAFLSQLETPCRQAAVIVRGFAGDWYSKHNFRGGITPAKSRAFAHIALKKLRMELEARGERDG